MTYDVIFARTRHFYYAPITFLRSPPVIFHRHKLTRHDSYLVCTSLTQQCLVGKMLPSWVMAFFFSFFSDGKRRHECASFFYRKKIARIRFECEGSPTQILFIESARPSAYLQILHIRSNSKYSKLGFV